MIPQQGLLLSSCLITLVASAAVKTPPGAGWASYAGKSAYSRAVGGVPPMPGMDTISVPYMAKSPFFPKFVDPKAMIAKKTEMLTNIFGGLGPAAYPPGFSPFTPYPAGGGLYSTGEEKDASFDKAFEVPSEDFSKTKIADNTGATKRGILGPFGGKFGPAGSKFGPMSGFGPMGQFGPMGPYGPMGQFGGPDMAPDYSMKDAYSRKRRSVDEFSSANLRSIMDDGKSDTKDLGPPPPYPILAPISEEPETEASEYLKPGAGSFGGAPKQFLPGMFGPVGPFGPFAPAVDPSMFIAKKNAFLDTLFKNLATSTPSPTTTVTPAPKSTIVPPSFWVPSSVIPSPTEYTDKVSTFLDKLFESLKLNKTTAAADDSEMLKSDFSRSAKTESDATEARIARSVDDLSSINDAKDTIVSTIMSELGDLKTDMLSTMTDLIAYEKAVSAAGGKKAFKPFAGGLWPKPTLDPTLPFQQRMLALSQVFDMLSDLQKNVTVAIQEAVKAKQAAQEAAAPINFNGPPASEDIYSPYNSAPYNMTLLDAIKKKLSAINVPPPMAYSPFSPFAPKFGMKKVRALPKSPGSFWVSYPDAASAVKRQAEDPMAASEQTDQHNQRQFSRAVKMQMHQGYQSLPAGSVESVQAGGGSVPGHQGGGIKLLDTSGYEGNDKWADWTKYMKNENQGRRHHNHNHH